MRLGQGRENSKKFIDSKPELLQEIEQAIAKKMAEAN
jgi:recombination protein RecA